LRVTQDKDGINKVHWTFHVSDVAIVRDEGMRDSLSKVLHLHSDGVDAHPLDTTATKGITDDLYPPDQRDAWSLKDPSVLGEVVTEAQSAARPTGMIGMYDSEGAFLGFKEEEAKSLPSIPEKGDPDKEEKYAARVEEIKAELERLSKIVIPEDDSVHEIHDARDLEEPPEPPRRPVSYEPEGEEVVERIGAPIPVRDPILARSLERGLDDGGISINRRRR
jgi:hypothetical protein